MDLQEQNQVISVYVVYQILKKLTTPFNKTDAFRLKIIDASGNILRKRHTLRTVDERNSATLLDVMVWKLKKLLEKLPFGKTKLASYAAALWLISENKNYEFFSINENSDLLYEGFGDYYLELNLSQQEKDFAFEMFQVIDSVVEPVEFTPTLKVPSTLLDQNFNEIYNKLLKGDE